MPAADFRRIALSFEGAEEGSHMGAPDFRVGGRIFATLAHESKGYGNLMLTPEQQADFVREMPDVFPFRPRWMGGGMTRPTSSWQTRCSDRRVGSGLAAAAGGEAYGDQKKKRRERRRC